VLALLLFTLVNNKAAKGGPPRIIFVHKDENKLKLVARPELFI